jgi:hypothetical protein
MYVHGISWRAYSGSIDVWMHERPYDPLISQYRVRIWVEK